MLKMPRIQAGKIEGSVASLMLLVCFFSSERASGLWFEREANRHRTPLEIRAAWEANEDEEGELKEFYEAC